MLRSSLALFLSCLCIHHTVLCHKSIGYIGPACVVVDDLLYLHGNYIRRLTQEELEGFQKYQGAVAIQAQLRDALGKGTASVSNGSTVLATPVLPSFCNGLDDQIEVVLDGCTVRNSRVYIADRLIRPLSAGEVEKVNALIRLSTYALGGHNQQQSAARRRRRSSATAGASSPSARSLDLLGHFLNVNSSVIERFLPVVRGSPLLQRIQGRADSGPHPEKTTTEGDDTARKRMLMQEIESSGGKESNVATGNITSGADSKPFLLPLNDDDGHPPTDSSSIEIPHLVLGASASQSQYYNSPPRSPSATSAPSAGASGADQLNLNDPMLLSLLRSLASQQPNAGQIQAFLNPSSAAAPLHPNTSPGAMYPGDRMVIGGQAYVAVPLNSYPPSSAGSGNSMPAVATAASSYPAANFGLGLMPVDHASVDQSSHQPNQPQYPQSSNWQYNIPQAIWSTTPTDAAYAAYSSAQAQANPTQFYHSPIGGAVSQTSNHGVNPLQSAPPFKPLVSSGGQATAQYMEQKGLTTPLAALSHEICQAHILEPFRMAWFSSQQH